MRVRDCEKPGLRLCVKNRGDGELGGRKGRRGGILLIGKRGRIVRWVEIIDL